MRSCYLKIVGNQIISPGRLKSRPISTTIHCCKRALNDWYDSLMPKGSATAGQRGNHRRACRMAVCCMNTCGLRRAREGCRWFKLRTKTNVTKSRTNCPHGDAACDSR
ncbi:hypothetical protein GQ600_6857 [Phytophthora cactorum]|nr:hypothetical protein GQ600_6857 [Phytophthora cactorum]